jgi:hypothetical protein
VRHDAEVDRGVIVQDPDLGLLAGRLPLGRLALCKITRDRRLLPRALVQNAVEDDAFLRANGGEAPAFMGCLDPPGNEDKQKTGE